MAVDVKKSTSEVWHSKLFRTLNSALCFSLAYALFNFIFWWAMVFAAKRYRIDSFVYYYGVKMMINSSLWDKDKVTFVYSAGPVACLVFSLIFLILYRLMRKLPSLINVFFLWGFVIGSCMFVAQGIIILLGAYNYSTPYYQGLAVVLSWWRVPVTAARLGTIPLFLLFIYLTLNYGRPFLLFSFSYSRINKLTRKRKYFFEVALVPFVIGAFITMLFTYPMNIQVNTVYLAVIGVGLLIAWYTLVTVKILRSQLLRYTNLQLPSIPFMVVFAIVCLFIWAIYGGMFVSI